MAHRKPPIPRHRRLTGFKAYRSKPLAIYAIGNLFGFMGVYIAFFYIQLYALAQTDISQNLSSYLLSIVNASTLLGRLISNYLADKIGPLNMQLPNALCATILSFCWIGIKTPVGIVVFAALYGFFAGAFNSLPGVTIISLSPDLNTIGIQTGIALTIAGIGALVGEPIAGAILRSANSWVGLQVWCGSLLLVFLIFATTARVLAVGSRLRVKA